MTRIDEMEKKYPGVPRDVIVKYDVMVLGIRPNDDLDKASVWKRSDGTYDNRDYDGTLQEYVEKTPWRAKPGYVLRADGLWLKSGLGADVRLRSSSCYEIKEVGERSFALYEGEQRVDDVYFIRRKPRLTPEPVTSRGAPISTLIGSLPSCVSIVPSRYCQYFSLGLQCKFCNFNVGHEDSRSAGLDIPVTINLEETVEAYKIRSKEIRIVEGSFVMGSFMKVEQDAKTYLGFIENLSNAAPYKPNFTLKGQAMERKDLHRLKDVGVDAVAVQIEVMDPNLFAEICPGKAKRMPYERWLEALRDTVDVLGVGNAGGKIVPGVTLLSSNGHRTWQEAQDYHVEANTYMIRNGVFPSWVPLWWAPGSVYSQDSSNLAKFPPTEYHLEVAQAHHEAMLEYGLYDKMNKLMHCPMDCSISYIGDIGILTLAGDVGSWVSDVVLEESRWLARFIASVRSPGKAE